MYLYLRKDVAGWKSGRVDRLSLRVPRVAANCHYFYNILPVICLLFKKVKITVKTQLICCEIFFIC